MKNHNHSQNEARILKDILGQFDGQNMVDEQGKIRLVPGNYASKSRLIEGDSLKLLILEDGTHFFKKLESVQRIKFIGTVVDHDEYCAIKDDEGKQYRVLSETTSYFALREGMKVAAETSEGGRWAAIINVIDE